MSIPNISRMSVDTLANRISEAKRVQKQAESDIKALTAALLAKGIEAGTSVETDISTVTVTNPYDRVDMDTNRVKMDIPDWKDKYGKVTHIGSTVRVTFK